jgi:NADPH:quinone reductase-like Zn-dependent oxidoreductase
MRAAQVEDFNAPPRYRENVAEPVAIDEEMIVTVRAAALTNLVRGQASGRHYSAASAQLPLTPGNDGVGVTPEGERVYFMGPRSPFGSMAERTVIKRERTIPLPAGLDDAVAAALGNPAIATWGALLGRAKFQPGERVLINGATGAAGKQAVQVAKRLGAARIVATARDAAALEQVKSLGADETVLLTEDAAALGQTFRGVFADGIDVVLDYLWGPSAEALLGALTGSGSMRGEPRVRYVQIGSISGDPIKLPSAVLRSSGVELLGSGLGSLSGGEIKESLTRMFASAAEQPLTIDIEPVPLAQVEAAWTRDTGSKRVVFLI